ncbi:hypothetical protein AGMMS49592_5030 [Endomicrobiia bacterium]|nr:hypothetical protein AGMMS49592_5030 [Endomicrobiia bacterium]
MKSKIFKALMIVTTLVGCTMTSEAMNERPAFREVQPDEEYPETNYAIDTLTPKPSPYIVLGSKPSRLYEDTAPAPTSICQISIRTLAFLEDKISKEEFEEELSVALNNLNRFEGYLQQIYKENLEQKEWCKQRHNEANETVRWIEWKLKCLHEEETKRLKEP